MNSKSDCAATGGTRHVVLVHGIFNTGWVFRTMVRAFEQKGFYCHVIRLTPSWGGAPIESLSAQLSQFIKNRVSDEEKVSLVGFSMGSLVCRYYLEYLDGIQKVTGFYSISGPHHGTVWSWFWVGKGTAQMRINSPFLRHLKVGEAVLRESGIPVVSYRTPYDQVIIPSTSSHWDLAENIVYPLISHQWMPHSKRVIEDISHRLATQSPDSDQI